MIVTGAEPTWPTISNREGGSKTDLHPPEDVHTAA
jgi:hypothetical protein